MGLPEAITGFVASVWSKVLNSGIAMSWSMKSIRMGPSCFQIICFPWAWQAKKSQKIHLSPFFLLTYNAPTEAFDNPEQDFFEGKGHDELFRPAHFNFRFFGMNPLETFACYDVLKNTDIESDFKRFEVHLGSQFPRVAS